jgi:DNA polymerase
MNANLLEKFSAQIDHTIDLLVQQQEDGELFVELDQQVMRELTAKSAAASAMPRASEPVRGAAVSPSERPKTAATRPAPKPAAAAPAPVRKQAVKAAEAPRKAIEATTLPDDIDALTAMIAGCTKCPLHQWRTRTVPGVGNPHPDIFFIGEGPGKDEDAQGIPFVGRAGQVLTRMISKMGYTRDEVFIGNIVKCRPTVNNEGRRDRPPTPEEMEGCLPYLRKQIELMQPKVLVLLGNTALQGLFGFKGITRRRGTWLEYDGIPTMPTFHPSFLLRNGGSSSEPFWQVWDDMCQVLKKLGREVPQVNAKRPEQSKLNI